MKKKQLEILKLKNEILKIQYMGQRGNYIEIKRKLVNSKIKLNKCHRIYSNNMRKQDHTRGNI